MDTLELLPHQEYAVSLMRKNFLLGDDCGLGKTRIGATAIVRYRTRSLPCMVVAPLSSLEWWRQNLIGCGFDGHIYKATSGSKSLPYNPSGTSLVLIHPEGLRTYSAIASKIKWDIILVDEAHRFKNRKAQRTKALWSLKARLKLAMTATPFGRGPHDLWGILHWLYPQKFPSYWKFFDMYVDSFVSPQGFLIINGGKNLDELSKEISPFYLRRERADLPPLEEVDVPVVLGKRQSSLYRTLLKENYLNVNGQEVIIDNLLTKILRLQQVSSDPATFLPFAEEPAKREWLLSWLQDNEFESVIIVSRFKELIYKWRQWIEAPVFTGDLSVEERENVLVQFEQQGKLLGTLGALSESLNLQRASTVIFIDSSWSPVEVYQMTKRIHRLGQKNPCHVYHLVGVLDDGAYTIDRLIRKVVTKRMSESEMIDEFVRSLKDGDSF